MATYYVDNDKTDDSGAGTSWATAKKTIQGAVNLITGALSGENFICLKSDAADPTYSGDAVIAKGDVAPMPVANRIVRKS